MLKKRRDSYYLDIGANIGSYCVELRAVDSNAQIVGYEANPRLESKRLPGADYETIVYRPVTIDGRIVVLNIDENESDNIGSATSIIVKPRNSRESIEIKSVAISEVLSKVPIGRDIVVKVDIEGAELEILDPCIWREYVNGSLFLVEEHAFLFEGEQRQEYKTKIKEFRRFVEKNGGEYVQWY